MHSLSYEYSPGTSGFKTLADLAGTDRPDGESPVNTFIVKKCDATAVR